eukprot:scaffold3733_cov53-Phaeocystis_antarctica.AAC.5
MPLNIPRPRRRTDRVTAARQSTLGTVSAAHDPFAQLLADEGGHLAQAELASVHHVGRAKYATENKAELASVHLVGEAVLLAVGAGEGEAVEAHLVRVRVRVGVRVRGASEREAVEAHLLRSSSTCSQSVAVVIVAIDSVGIVSVAIVNVGIVSRLYLLRLYSLRLYSLSYTNTPPTPAEATRRTRGQAKPLSTAQDQPPPRPKVRVGVRDGVRVRVRVGPMSTARDRPPPRPKVRVGVRVGVRVRDRPRPTADLGRGGCRALDQHWRQHPMQPRATRPRERHARNQDGTAAPPRGEERDAEPEQNEGEPRRARQAHGAWRALERRDHC